MPQTVSSTNIQELLDDRPEGGRAGRASTSLFALWGATPTTQPANVATVATSTITTAATTTSPWGFATSTQADAITAQVVLLRSAINSLLTNLNTIGAQASS